MFSKLKKAGFQIRALHHAEAILRCDLREAITDIEAALSALKIPVDELVKGGGGEGQMTQRLRKYLSERCGWGKHTFEIRKIVDGEERELLTHEIDHVKSFKGGTCALEIEWNNKDPFFDRDLENFKRLHADGVISVGGIITRGASLQEAMPDLVEAFAVREGIDSAEKLSALYTPTPRQKELISKHAASRGSFAKGWAHAFVSDKFGEATTHWRKLEERINRGVGNPCPLLIIGIPVGVVEV